MQIKIGFPENPIGKILFAPFALIFAVVIIAALTVCIPVYVAYEAVVCVVAIPVALWETWREKHNRTGL